MGTPDREKKSAARSSRAGRASLWIKKFGEIGIEDVPVVGGKTASLGEMFRKRSPKGVRVPDGFAITADAYLTHLILGVESRVRDRCISF
jgi:pyruvate, water dikinase